MKDCIPGGEQCLGQTLEEVEKNLNERFGKKNILPEEWIEDV